MGARRALRSLFAGDKVLFYDTQNECSLDLTYITDRIVAMGYPSQGKIRKYVRNNLKDVVRFLQTYHAQKYMVFNLAMEVPYDFTRFENRVMCFGFNDHCAPPLQLLVRVVHAIDDWLKLNPEHCAFIHCKAGRGRTGTVIASYLLWSGFINKENSKHLNPVDVALTYFASKRSKTSKGVVVPSQKRYVQYFYQLMTSKVPIRLDRKLALTGIVLHNFPSELLNGLSVKITDLEVIPAILPIIVPNSLRRKSPFQTLTNGDQFLSFLSNHIILEGDVLVCIRIKKPILPSKSKTSRLCRLAFHTAFIDKDTLELDKHQLDGGYGNQLTDPRFSSSFRIKLLFSSEAVNVQI